MNDSSCRARGRLREATELPAGGWPVARATQPSTTSEGRESGPRSVLRGLPVPHGSPLGMRESPRMRASSRTSLLVPVVIGALVIVPAALADTATRTRSPSGTRRSSGSSTSRRSAARASPTSRPTSTSSSTSRPLRSAGRGTAPISSRSRRRRPISSTGTSTTSTSPATRSTPGCDYELWARPTHGGNEADRLRPRRQRPRLPRQARAPVLVLLPLQRLQQHARGRLGDDPARLRRRPTRREALTKRAGRGRLQLARGRRARDLGRREARDRRRHAPGRLPGRGLAREQVHGGALSRELRRGGRRLRRHARPASRGAVRS